MVDHDSTGSEFAFDASMRDRWVEEDDGWVFELPPGWGQGRSVFGGLAAAVALSLGERVLPTARPLRTMSVQLLRPTAAGPVQGEAVVLREGKNMTFAEVGLSQGGKPTVRAQLVYGAPRTGGLVVDAPPAWEGPPPESLDSMVAIPSVIPEFVQHVHMRFAGGGPPYSGADEARFDGYCRFRGPAGGVQAIVGMLDFWPAPSLSVLRKPAVASTVSWTMHLLRVPASFDAWFKFRYETVVGEGGMHTLVGQLHGPDGALLGWTEQLTAVFD